MGRVKPATSEARYFIRPSATRNRKSGSVAPHAAPEAANRVGGVGGGWVVWVWHAGPACLCLVSEFFLAFEPPNHGPLSGSGGGGGGGLWDAKVEPRYDKAKKGHDRATRAGYGAGPRQGSSRVAVRQATTGSPSGLRQATTELRQGYGRATAGLRQGYEG